MVVIFARVVVVVSGIILVVVVARVVVVLIVVSAVTSAALPNSSGFNIFILKKTKIAMKIAIAIRFNIKCYAASMHLSLDQEKNLS